MKKLFVLALFSSLALAGCAQQGLSQSELFEKKQECAKYEDEIRNSIAANVNLTDLFYSPSLNTCVYSYEAVIDGKVDKIIIDYLSTDTLYYCEGIIRPIQSCYDKIKELKGE